jgi:hypothetical protein
MLVFLAGLAMTACSAEESSTDDAAQDVAGEGAGGDSLVELASADLRDDAEHAAGTQWPCLCLPCDADEDCDGDVNEGLACD